MQMSTYFRALTVFLLVLGLLGAVPAAAKTLRLAMDAEPVSMDPHAHLSTGTLQFSHLVFDPLVRWTQAMDFEPRLAHKWERIDDRTLRFHLHKGVTFHSGNPLTVGRRMDPPAPKAQRRLQRRFRTGGGIQNYRRSYHRSHHQDSISTALKHRHLYFSHGSAVLQRCGRFGETQGRHPKI